MNRCPRPLTRFASFLARSVIALAALAVLSADAAARTSSRKSHGTKESSHHRGHTKPAADERDTARSEKSPASEDASATPLSGDLAAIKDAIALARRGKTG